MELEAVLVSDARYTRVAHFPGHDVRPPDCSVCAALCLRLCSLALDVDGLAGEHNHYIRYQTTSHICVPITRIDQRLGVDCQLGAELEFKILVHSGKVYLRIES